jgi:drug/metabolite transporter (DMT)-like permease
MNTFLLIALIVTATVANDLLQSREMKRNGCASLGLTLRLLLTRPALLASLVCQAVSFYAHLLLLDKAGLSIAVPATAATIVVETALARWYLRENVDARRWAGAALVALGVGLLLA